MKFETTFSPRFRPKSNLLIYHYCNDFVLESICQNQEIWLSDIYAMNDSSEFNWGRELFIKALKENKDEFDQRFRFYIIGVVMSAVPNTLPLIACFSRSGDLLSQWRAYADDGRGFSIGFDSRSVYLGLDVNMNSVVYQEKKQYNLVLNTLRGIHAMWKTYNEDFNKIQEPSMIFSIDIAYLKNSTFFEEQEIRIIRLLTKEGEEFTDGGGNSKINDIKPLNVLSRTRDGVEIKYLKLPIKIRGNHIIKEVIIGPKNETTVEQVKQIMLHFGLNNVLVKKSESTYR